MAGIVAGLALAVIIGVPLQWLSLRLKLGTRHHLPVIFHRWVCWLMGIRVRVVGRLPAERPLLIVGNHVSWLDIVVIGSLFPLSFIAKAEVGTWPLFGLLARLQRTIFVDRQKRSATGEVNREIGERLAEGDPIVLFGEGTTGDGHRILPFRSALLGAAREAMGVANTERVQVLPMAITYTARDGLPLGRPNRHAIAWYGDTELEPHLTGVLRDGPYDAVVSLGEPAGFNGTTDRKQLTRDIETSIRRMAATARDGRDGRNPPE
jgi:1-acyl-sn-glycerol-3-phosphate acyltransferase